MRNFLIFVILLLPSFAHAQLIDTSALETKISSQDAQIKDILEKLAELEQKIDNLSTPSPITYPYSNWENSKYTFPDAKEYPALDVMKMTSEYIRFNADGSITYSLPAGLTGTPTANAKFLRIERREYKDMAVKTNYKKGDKISRNNCVIFHKLNLGVSDAVFTQVHGTPWIVNSVKSDTPYFKWVAGKDGVRAQFKTKWGLAEDDKVVVLLPKADLKLETKYCYNWTLDGSTMTYNFNGVKGVVNFDRPDEFYPKDGLYGPVGASLTHTNP